MLITCDSRDIDRDYFLDMASFYCKVLGIAQIPDVEIEIVPYTGEDVDGYAVGYCYDMEDGYILIEIACDLRPADGPLGRVLAHEMVHARQTIQGTGTFCEDEAVFLEEILFRAYMEHPRC